MLRLFLHGRTIHHPLVLNQLKQICSSTINHTLSIASLSTRQQQFFHRSASTTAATSQPQRHSHRYAPTIPRTNTAPSSEAASDRPRRNSEPSNRSTERTDDRFGRGSTGSGTGPSIDSPFSSSRPPPPPPSAASIVRQRTRDLKAQLRQARQEGTAVHIPSLLDRPSRTRSKGYQGNTPSGVVTANATGDHASDALFGSSPRPQHQRRSVTERQTKTQVEELEEMMNEQLNMVQPENPHLANIVILGTPNAGKSTLVNYLVGQKISAVSHKRNTTRTSVLGVACRENRQLVIFDTPGVLPDQIANKYQKELSKDAWDSAQGADTAVVIVDVVKHFGPAEYELFQKAKALKESNPGMSLILVLNKMDLCKPAGRSNKVADLIQQFVTFDKVYRTSLIQEKGLPELANELFSAARPGDWEYPPTMKTDQSQIELVNEIIREKIFERVHQEIPYRVKITNTGWTHLTDTTMRVDILLEVETKQQKAILTGHNNSMFRYIVERALPEVQALVGKTVYIFLKCTLAHTL